jgi:predicted transcriptional regulator
MKYVYSPAKEPESVRFSLVKDLIKKVFDGSPKELVQTLIKNEDISDEELREIQKYINDMEN